MFDTWSCSASSWESLKIRPFSSCFTSSCKLKRRDMKTAGHPVSARFMTHQLKWTAQTGRQQPNMSTTFMGRSRPLDDMWRQTPRSAEPARTIKGYKEKNSKEQHLTMDTRPCKDSLVVTSFILPLNPNRSSTSFSSSSLVYSKQSLDSGFSPSRTG